MTDGNEDLERLRSAFLALEATTTPPAACPAGEELWDAAHGKLPPELTARLVEHLVLCPACVEAWRLAVSTGEGSVQGRRGGVRAVRAMGLRLAAAAAVIAVLTGVLYERVHPSRPGTDVYRGTESGIRSLVPESQELARENVVLRWTAVDAAALYRVRVTSADLSSLATASDLQVPEFRVQPGVLAGLPSGARVLWQVEATLPDGHSLVSPTFSFQLH